MEFQDTGFHFLCVIEEEERENGDGDSFIEGIDEENFQSAPSSPFQINQKLLNSEPFTSSFQADLIDNCNIEFGSNINEPNKNREFDENIDDIRSLLDTETNNKKTDKNKNESTDSRCSIDGFHQFDDDQHQEDGDGGNEMNFCISNNELFGAILEAPEEFNIVSSISKDDGEKFEKEQQQQQEQQNEDDEEIQVTVNQPSREPEKDPPNHDNYQPTISTETGDTIQRPLHQLFDVDYGKNYSEVINSSEDLNCDNSQITTPTITETIGSSPPSLENTFDKNNSEQSSPTLDSSSVNKGISDCDCDFRNNVHVGTNNKVDAPKQEQQQQQNMQIDTNERGQNIVELVEEKISEMNICSSTRSVEECVSCELSFENDSSLNWTDPSGNGYCYWSSSPSSYQITSFNKNDEEFNNTENMRGDGNIFEGIDDKTKCEVILEICKQDDNNNIESLDEKCQDISNFKGILCGFSCNDNDLAQTPSPKPAQFPAPVEPTLNQQHCAHLNDDDDDVVYKSSITTQQLSSSSSIDDDADAFAPAPGRRNISSTSSTETSLSRGGVVGSDSSTSGSGCTISCDHPGSSCANSSREDVPFLKWSFKNGRLVFDNESENNENGELSEGKSEQDCSVDLECLTSKDINKRIFFDDGKNTRLKFLETKLRKAGITDEQPKEKQQQIQSPGGPENPANRDLEFEEQVVDKSKSKEQNDSDYFDQENQEEENENDDAEEFFCESLKEFSSSNSGDLQEFCQFDVNNFPSSSSSTIFNGNCLVYDELIDEYPDEEEDDDRIIFEPFAMGTTTENSERPKHNPDTDNLKSLLKRPNQNNGSNSTSNKRDKKQNRVVFNENKNEFFDADYIILIREECDYDDEDDDSVCTCNQHEMVRLTCCEPNCNCEVYDASVPQSPKFAPPLEFVDAVTLSPPEGYKDMELEEQELFTLHQMVRNGQQRRAVCRECSATHDDDDEAGSQSDEGECQQSSDIEEREEREKTDQSQQTTPTTPEKLTAVEFSSDDSASRDSISSYTKSEQQPQHQQYVHSSDLEDERMPSPYNNNLPHPGGSPISGILKGGKLWKQTSLENSSQDLQQFTDSSLTSDEENGTKRSVRFVESNDQRGGCDGASDDSKKDEETASISSNLSDHLKPQEFNNPSISPESTEMMLTFKLGNHVLISNNSLKPNSAVRQLFPCTKDENTTQKYLVTAESLRAFEETKRSKLPQVEPDESLRKAIERNTLRRSLIRYEPRAKKNQPKTDNSLVERIKQLTCDVDNNLEISNSEENRASPTGEETAPEKRSQTTTASVMTQPIHQQQLPSSFSPSSSSSAASSNSSNSVSNTYKKLTDLFSKKEKAENNQNLVNNSTTIVASLPDLGNGPHELDHIQHQHQQTMSRINATNVGINEGGRKQFLPSLACVSGIGSSDDYYYPGNQQMQHQHQQVVSSASGGGCVGAGERASLASSVGTEYSLEDIDEVLKNNEDSKRITPDVLAGTPSASESGDELAMFVQQDAGRIERIKKKYQPEGNSEDDDEHNDYGFNKRPSVRGIKPRFGTTTQIIQQIQNQMQPSMEASARVSWPYYSENVDNSKTKNLNQNIPYNNDSKNKITQQQTQTYTLPNSSIVYRPTSLSEENFYHHSGQFCTKQVYRINGNPVITTSNAAAPSNYPTAAAATVMKFGRCNEIYQSLPRQKTNNGRPMSPPPLEMSRTYHQTMVYIPYNHLERYQGAPNTSNMYQTGTSSNYARINTNQNRFIEPIYQQSRFHMHVEDHQVTTQPAPRPFVRIPYNHHHPPPQIISASGVKTRSESPQFSTARSTQTPVPNCNYYNPRTSSSYRPVVITPNSWQNEPTYVSKMNRHSFPNKYSSSDTSTDTECSQNLPQNGYRQSIEISFSTKTDMISSTSPTKPKFMERGVPEGAASVSPPDPSSGGGGKNSEQNNSSTMTSPQQQNPMMQQQQKPMFYAMNV